MTLPISPSRKFARFVAALPFYLDELLGHYKLDANGNDNSGLGNNGTVEKAAPSYVAGKLGNALDFDGGGTLAQPIGTHQAVLLPNSIDTAILSADAFSISCWFYAHEVLSATRSLSIFGKMVQKSPSTGLFRLIIPMNNNKLQASCIFDGGASYCLSTDAMVVNTWYHVVMTASGIDGTTRLYINGNLNNSGSPMSGHLHNTEAGSRILLGAVQYTTTNQRGDYFDGLIDDVAIWSRVFTQDNVTDLYNAASGFTWGPTV